MKFLMLLGVLFSLNVKAETNSDELTLADEAIQSPSMDIEGQYQVKEVKEVRVAPAIAKEVQVEAPKKVIKRLSQSDRLKIYRERLEERNKIMVERKMEQIRFQQELALARKLEQSMNQTLKAIDTVK
jgi:hypothetical protein